MLGLSVNITTNGTRVEGMFEALVQSGVDSLSFSLDGLQDTHERISGKAGCFEETCSAIRRIKNETDIATSVYLVAAPPENIAQALWMCIGWLKSWDVVSTFGRSMMPQIWRFVPRSSRTIKSAVAFISSSSPMWRLERRFIEILCTIMQGTYRENAAVLGLWISMALTMRAI